MPRNDATGRWPPRRDKCCSRFLANPTAGHEPDTFRRPHNAFWTGHAAFAYSPDRPVLTPHRRSCHRPGSARGTGSAAGARRVSGRRSRTRPRSAA
ncbi:hypothetical protein PBRA_009591 [Plasmodiophora brassicae]|uniref:Uncharacterized protein n=1 Tax=Plasmodiophora brassicae TaxID=37360 RepID=A0A0G4IIT9_PLABS|nr:hypothetical protein PBRA_009591 [Plasmodiophora brassicae]